MAFTPDTADVKWLVGAEVDEARSVMREVDTSHLIAILYELFDNGGAMHAIGKHAQAIADQARDVVAGRQIARPLKIGNPATNVFDFYNAPPPQQGPDPFGKAKEMVRGLATVNLYHGDRIINPLAIGDFTRFFGDIFNELPGTATQPFQDLKNLLRSLQNPVAFNKSTNRVRVHRRDIFQQGPGVGLVQWYLPPDDVLGAMDRMLGYYETADISGSTTDSLAALAMVATIVETQNALTIGTLDQIKLAAVEMINDGRAFGSFASIVAQMHHSLPESMMAINLIPPAALTQSVNNVPVAKLYSPYLTNSDFARITALYRSWREARNLTLKITQPRANYVYALFVLQDVYQMPNRPALSEEVGLIVGLSLAGNAATDNDMNSNIFGANAYNAFVAGLNAPGPGPAPSLQRLSNRILPGATASAPLFEGTFNPALGNKAVAVRAAVTKGMGLGQPVLAQANTLADIVRPFIEVTEYGVVGTVPV